MLVVLSPAKKLDFDAPAAAVRATQPRLLPDTRELMATVRGLSASDLKRLMRLSDPLAELNHARFRDFADDPKAAPVDRAAVYAFRGDTYVGLAADDFDKADLAFAQQHLRILSGLYGLLRPLDRIQPYRLEMGTKVATERGRSLYDFWGDKLAAELSKSAAACGAKALVNCASQEYFSAARAHQVSVPTVTPVFKEMRDGRAKIISFSAKRARGMMARFVVKHRLTEPQQLREFAEAGYRFTPEASSDRELVFIRPQPTA